MTLYQRMYACRNVREAKKAWYIAGFFEYPVMAFIGVFLGVCSRAYFQLQSLRLSLAPITSDVFLSAGSLSLDSETAVPLMIKFVLPVGITGIVIAAYFSAIMSTADSCLMASSGNITNDLIDRLFPARIPRKHMVKISQVVTFCIGALAILLASQFNSVLDGILHAYAFMVSGLFIPTLAAYFWSGSKPSGALAGMLAGGGTTLILLLVNKPVLFQLDPTFFGILASLIAFVLTSIRSERGLIGEPDIPKKEHPND